MASPPYWRNGIRHSKERLLEKYGHLKHLPLKPTYIFIIGYTMSLTTVKTYHRVDYTFLHTFFFNLNQ